MRTLVAAPIGTGPQRLGTLGFGLPRPAPAWATRAGEAVARWLLGLDRALDVLDDCLTDRASRAHTRGYMDHVLRRALGRDGLSAAIALVDVDGAEALRRREGPDGGADALRVVGSLLRQAVGAGGVVARHRDGGLLALMPGQSLDQARSALEEVQRQLAFREAAPAAPRLSLTISAGVVCVARPGAGLSASYVHEAVRALYMAQQAGGDRVVAIEWDQGDAPEPG